MDITFILALVGTFFYIQYLSTKKQILKENLYKFVIEVNYMNGNEYGKEFLNELLKMKYRNNVIELMTIAVLESEINKYAIGDKDYEGSYGYFQINMNDGEKDDKNSTLEIFNRYDYFVSEFENIDFIDREIIKIKKGNTNSVLFNTDVQFHLANNGLNIIKQIIKDKGYKVTQDKIAYLWNAGINSDIEEIDVWKYNYKYWDKYKKIQEELIKIWGD